ncbi:MAG: insulinase family protein [Rikenellaceae bacterium]|jgi:predicted Zn-dependent peptidase|nr:insulinase family protein [Rikenellaceae bacterium]
MSGRQEYYFFTLPNGIRCILGHAKGPVAHCALTVGAGSRDEPEGVEGVAHFTEHCLFKGTARRRAHHINCRLENLGGELNAFTTKEETVVHATTLRGDFAAAAELIADVMFHSVFPEQQVTMERAVVADEINSYKDSPGESIWDDFEDLLFAGSGLGHNILGTNKSLRRLNRKAITDFTDRTYNTDQMVFSAVGNISEKRFREVSERYFGAVTTSPRGFARTAPMPVETFDKTVKRNNHQAHCLTGGRAWDAFNGRRIALSLLVNILGGPAANSLLNIALREKRGLTYNIDASYTPFCDSGIAAISYSCEKARIDECIELVDKELTAIKTTPLTDRKLSMAKRQFAGQLAISMESNEGAMLAAGKSFLLYDRVDSLAEVNRKLAALTAGQVMDAANEIFTGTSTLIYK